jgi:CRP-like cAMP-binding protein
MPSSDGHVDRVLPNNRLLAALPAHEHECLRPHLEPVSLALKAVLSEAGQPLEHVYFLTSGVVSLLSPPESSNSGVEVGLVGREGMLGLSVFLGAETAAVRSLVQIPGEALRMATQAFREQVGRHTVLHGLLLRYTDAFLVQVTQSLTCNSLHPLQKRLCRWLLMMHSRVESDSFLLTHEFLAAMLGVRRASVSEAARQLRDDGVISYDRGQVTVLDHGKLESTACGCHHMAQKVLDQLFG